MNKKDQGDKDGPVRLQGLPVIDQQVAGIDLGSEEHWVCAPTEDGEGREVARFEATTPALQRLSEWLRARGVRSVAMESTGVYWIAPHELLEAAGFHVLLVDTRQLARVPGRSRKTDPTDCEWIQRLHGCGLLRGAFRPPEQICMLRTLVRDRSNLIAERGDWLRRMQKSLDQMNVRVHRAVSDLDGVTGMAILRAIAAGERDAGKLAQLRDRRCQRSEEEIAAELTGHWREDHLFSLQQGLKMYDAIQQCIADYEARILQQLGTMQREELRQQPPPKVNKPNKAKQMKARGQEPLREALFRLSGADLTAISALGVDAVQVVLSEYGPDLSRFPNEKHFSSHTTLAPRQAVSGGKPVSRKRRSMASTRVAGVLRMAALSQRNSDTALGAYYRRIARRLGAKVAVFATARRLAVLIYRLLRWGQPYVDEGAEAFEKRHEQARIRRLTASAKQLGYQLVPVT